jgi:hypothetical protein
MSTPENSQFARHDLERAAREFAANLLRLVAGAGDTPALFAQMHALEDAFVAYHDLGDNDPSATEVLETALRSHLPDWNGGVRVLHPEHSIVISALRLAAARLLAQRENLSHSALLKALRDHAREVKWLSN